MATGWVVLVVCCLLAALLLPIAWAWSRLRAWRYTRLDEILPGDEVDEPLPPGAVAIWERYDPSHLGLRPLGVVRSSPQVTRDELTKLWVGDDCVAGVTCRRRGEEWVCRRRGVTTYLGDRSAPRAVGTVAASSAALRLARGPSTQVLFWPSDDQSPLLDVHRRQLRAVGGTPIVVTSLADLRSLASASRTAFREAALASGRFREEGDGRLALRRRASVSLVWAQLPTRGLARRRADRRARRIVATWPPSGPAAFGAMTARD